VISVQVFCLTIKMLFITMLVNKLDTKHSHANLPSGNLARAILVCSNLTFANLASKLLASSHYTIANLVSKI